MARLALIGLVCALFALPTDNRHRLVLASQTILLDQHVRDELAARRLRVGLRDDLLSEPLPIQIASDQVPDWLRQQAVPQRAR